jgi:serine protease AprX
MWHFIVRPSVAILLAAGLIAAGHVAGSASALRATADKPAAALRATADKPAVERARVIVRMAPGTSAADLAPVIERLGGTIAAPLDIIHAQIAELPQTALGSLAGHPLVAGISPDRAVTGTMERTSATIGATMVREILGYDGSGVGMAIIDSGITPWHDDLAAPGGGQRVADFVDFVRNRRQAYDDYGHGTHVAGIIAGDGFDSGGARMGVAPGARLTVLKVLDDQGDGRISDVIAAFDYVLRNRDTSNIRVVNLSVATGVYESYSTDPLTLAAKRLVDAGIVVVAAAGNLGRTREGQFAYGGITSPGNAPWVLTVGASSHMGTPLREDDRIAAFSSRGPSAIDYAAKPDLVAPGVGIESLSDPDSTFYRTMSPYLLGGTMVRGYLPYLSLTGTSMSAPVVAGTIALMLQANPALTPNAVKAILQYTSETYDGYDPLTQGAGFLNAAGAVEMARAFGLGTSTPGTSSWSRQILWGNVRIRGGRLSAGDPAWAVGVVWGATSTASGEPIEWHDAGSTRNIVWGARCGGRNCQEEWTLAAAVDESVVWGTAIDQSVVWGTWATDQSVVWGTTMSGRW